MLISADEAKAKWCPMVRMAEYDAMNNANVGPAVNRFVVNVDGQTTWVGRCIADECMAWCWAAGMSRGYCGLAGQ